MSSAEKRLLDIESRIVEACRLAKRPRADVSLVAVSKTHPLAAIDELAAAGHSVFGENYVQEAIEKVEQRPQYEWHFIGHLQSNKIKDVVGRFSLIHSVDRLKTLQGIEQAAAKFGVQQEVLLQIHVGDELSKKGFSPLEIFSVIEFCLQLKHVRVRGLMALPPLEEQAQESRKHFRFVAEQLDEIKHRLTTGPKLHEFAQQLTVLSMGTTHDFESAILEGATHIRVGTALFGPRSTPG